MDNVFRVLDNVFRVMIVVFAFVMVIVCAIFIRRSIQPSKSIENMHVVYDVDNENIRVVVIDSCEYIERTMGRYYSLIHKGNCRFCEERKGQ